MQSDICDGALHCSLIQMVLKDGEVDVVVVPRDRIAVAIETERGGAEQMQNDTVLGKHAQQMAEEVLDLVFVREAATQRVIIDLRALCR